MFKQRDATIAELQHENARLWRSYEMPNVELALVKRRLFLAKAERVDTTQLQMEFDELAKKLNRLAGELPAKSARGRVHRCAAWVAGATQQQAADPA
jgi:FtsZ-binding cell division protein ZapB